LQRQQLANKCLNDLNRARDAMWAKARQCGRSFQNIQTLRTARQRFRVTRGGQAFWVTWRGPQCRLPLYIRSRRTQENAYLDCLRVYVCGVFAAGHAMTLVRRGTQCKTAVSLGQRRYPIPR